MTKLKRRSRKTNRSSRQDSPPLISPAVIGGVVVAAVLVVVGLFFLGYQADSSAAPTDLDQSQFPAMGDPDAPVTIVEYSDYGCPHCRDFNLDTLPQLEEDYIETGQVYYVIHPFYLGNPAIAQAGEAAMCAGEQGEFFTYHHALFENFGVNFTNNTFTELAAGLGLDEQEFSQCLSSNKYNSYIEAGRDAATNLGISSTPTFFINGQRVEGNQPYSAMRQIIEQELSLAQ